MHGLGTRLWYKLEIQLPREIHSIPILRLVGYYKQSFYPYILLGDMHQPIEIVEVESLGDVHQPIEIVEVESGKIVDK